MANSWKQPLIGLLISIAFTVGPALAAEPDGKIQDRIAALIHDLDANDFATREQASVELAKIAEPALPASRRRRDRQTWIGPHRRE